VEPTPEDPPFTLAEDLLLLTGRDSDRPFAVTLHYGVAGALLADLQTAGRLGITQERVTVTDPAPTGDGELDAVLAEIANDKPRSRDYWVRELASMQRTSRLAGRLADRSGLRARRAGLRSRVTRVLLDQSTSDDRAQALGAIVAACALTKKVFPNVDRRFRRRAAELSSVQPAAAGVRQAINQARLRAWLPGLADLFTP
jgi:hypothetical protein